MDNFSMGVEPAHATAGNFQPPEPWTIARARPADPMRFMIPLPEKAALAPNGSCALSPDAAR
jgi:hypothetical protein